MASEPLTYRADIESWTQLAPGQFCYQRATDGSPEMIFFWPIGSVSILSASLVAQSDSYTGAAWTLSGPEDAPTLRPGIDEAGVWRGTISNGFAQAALSSAS